MKGEGHLIAGRDAGEYIRIGGLKRHRHRWPAETIDRTMRNRHPLAGDGSHRTRRGISLGYACIGPALVGLWLFSQLLAASRQG